MANGQTTKRQIELNAVGSPQILIENAQSLRFRNFADTLDIPFVNLDASDNFLLENNLYASADTSIDIGDATHRLGNVWSTALRAGASPLVLESSANLNASGLNIGLSSVNDVVINTDSANPLPSSKNLLLEGGIQSTQDNVYAIGNPAGTRYAVVATRSVDAGAAALNISALGINSNAGAAPYSLDGTFITMNAKQIQSVADPTSPQDAATKFYVDNQGVVEASNATLVGGTVVVPTANLMAGDRIMLTVNTPGGTQGFISAPDASRVAGVSFTINSSDGGDTSSIDWAILR